MVDPMTRKQFITSAAAVSAAILTRSAFAARRYVIRIGVDVANDSPTTIGLVAASRKIKDATNGEVDVQVFPNNQLGDDSHMLSNLRSGAIQMMVLGDNILASLVPSAAIDNIGFAFRSPEVAWNALDGDVGDIIRADIVTSGLIPMRRIWDEGFRQITSSEKPINTPQDLRGYKMRVPPSPISLSMFRSFGAAPVTINSAEIYTSLQTHLVDGQENPLGVIETLKFYQVQKYCSLTNHMWVGYWILANGAFWNSMPEDYRNVVANALDAQALEQRAANQKLENSLEITLKQQGLSFVAPEQALFQQALRQAEFYKNWKTKFGSNLWSALEKYTGPLA
jgi:TRAP-type transport system periplasmic protein